MCTVHNVLYYALIICAIWAKNFVANGRNGEWCMEWARHESQNSGKWKRKKTRNRMRNKYFSIKVIAGKSNPNSIQTKQFQIWNALFVLGDAVRFSYCTSCSVSVCTRSAQTHLDFTFFVFDLTLQSAPMLSTKYRPECVCLEVLALERERAGEMVSYEIVAHNCATHYYFIVWFCDDYKTH